MNALRHSLLLTTACSVAAFSFTGCSDRDRREMGDKPTYVDSHGVTRNAASDAPPAGSVLSGTWDDIKDYTYERRADFTAAMNRMATRLDRDTADLSAKRAQLSGDTARAWDRAMDDLKDARKDLQEELSDLQKASAEKWSDAKAEVAKAWQRTESAYLSLKAHHTP